MIMAAIIKTPQILFYIEQFLLIIMKLFCVRQSFNFILLLIQDVNR